MLATTKIGAQYAHATHQNRHFRRCQTHQLRSVEQHFFGGHCVVFLHVVAETIRKRLEHVKRFRIGLLVGRITTTRSERHGHVDAGFFCSFLNRRSTRQYDHVSNTDRLGEANSNAFQNR